MHITIENAADFVRSNSPEAVRAAVQELYKAETAAKKALQEKCGAYFDGKKERLQRIAAQFEKVKEQREAVEKEKARHDRAMVEATISGDGETVSAIQKELERCASAIAAYDAQIEVFKNYELCGDEAIAAEIAQDHAALLELISENSKIRGGLFMETEKLKHDWAAAVFDPNKRGMGVSGYRELWMDAFNWVQNDQRKAPQTVGQRLDAAAADAKTAAARQQGASAPSVVFSGH